MAFAGIEPFGEERADVRAGIIASVIANVNRDAKKRSQPFAPSDFMPFREKADATPPPPATPEDLTASLKVMFRHPSVRQV